MTDVNDLVKHIVLAHADDDIQCLAFVYLKKDGEPEIHYAVNNIQAYAINFGLDVIKAGIMSDVIRNASKPSEERE